MPSHLCRTCGHMNKLLGSEPRRRISLQVVRSCMNKDQGTELPPEPTTCCMSGCANCVWIEYAETLSKHMHGNDDKARELILSKISDPNLKMFLAMELRNIHYSKETKPKQ